MVEAFGLPIRRIIRYDFVAEARGIWPFKWIAISPYFELLSEPHKMAVLAHEAGHCHHFHFEKRILAVPFLILTPKWASELAHDQEMEADEFAARAGYGLDLMQMLDKHLSEENEFYPSNATRSSRLREICNEMATA